MLQREYKTIKYIATHPNWEEPFKASCKKVYYQFRERDIEVTGHFAERFLSRKNQKGYPPFEIDDIIEQLKKPVNYMEQNGYEIKYYDYRTIVIDQEIQELVSIVNRKGRKEQWIQVS